MVDQRASKKQQELLSFVDGFIKGNGYGPSYREIMRALGYKSVSTVAIHIDGLIAKGYLARRDKSARSLEIVSVRTPVSGIEESKVNLDQELKRHIASVDLNDEQKLQVAESLELLGFEQALAALREGLHDA